MKSRNLFIHHPFAVTAPTNLNNFNVEFQMNYVGPHNTCRRIWNCWGREDGLMMPAFSVHKLFIPHCVTWCSSSIYNRDMVSTHIQQAGYPPIYKRQGIYTYTTGRVSTHIQQGQGIHPYANRAEYPPIYNRTGYPPICNRGRACTHMQQGQDIHPYTVGAGYPPLNRCKHWSCNSRQGTQVSVSQDIFFNKYKYGHQIF